MILWYALVLIQCTILWQAEAVFDLNTSLANSGITGIPTCYPNDNRYQAIIANAFPIDIAAQVVVNCAGYNPLEFLVALPAFNSSSVLSFQATYPVVFANTACQFTLLFPNPFNPGSVVSVGPNWSSPCGSIPPDVNDGYTQGCSYVAYFCQISNGWWYRYGPFLCTMELVWFILVMLAAILGATLSGPLILRYINVVPTKKYEEQSEPIEREPLELLNPSHFSSPKSVQTIGFASNSSLSRAPVVESRAPAPSGSSQSLFRRNAL